MVGNCGDRLVLVVNAARKEADEAHLRVQAWERVRRRTTRSRADRAPGAESGSGARAARTRVHEHAVHGVVRTLTLMGAECMVMRLGLHRGRRIRKFQFPPTSLARSRRSCSQIHALHRSDSALGIRFAWRLDYAFMAQTSTRSTTPVEAGLSWAIQKVRRRGGAREGSFPGLRPYSRQLEARGASASRGPAAGGTGACARRRNAFCGRGREGLQIGSVTSGGFGPSLNAPIAMGYLPTALAVPGTTVFCRSPRQALACRRHHAPIHRSRSTSAAEPPDTWRMHC